MKKISIVLCLIIVMGFSGMSRAEYSQRYCDDLLNDIIRLEAKIKKFEGLVYNSNTIMGKYVCMPGEDIAHCVTRCGQRFDATCFIDGKTVWFITNEYQLQGHPDLPALKRLTQSRKNSVMGTRTGNSGKLPEWRKTLNDWNAKYEERCGFVKGKKDSLFKGTGDDLDLRPTD